jgi:hypothetical protein
MNKIHAAFLLVALAMVLGWQMSWMANIETMPARTLPESHKTSAAESAHRVPETTFTPTAQGATPVTVASPTIRDNAAVATSRINRDTQGESRPESLTTQGGVRNSTFTSPPSSPELVSVNPPANTALSASVAMPSPAPLVVDQDIPVPRGEALPAAIMDEGYGASPGQIQGLDDIAGEFLDNALVSGSPTYTDPQSWRDATRLADERYRSMFGAEAFNRWSIEAAKEALAEKP